MPRRRRVERQRVKVCLCLLGVRLAGGTFLVSRRDQGADGQLRKSHRREERLGRQTSGVRDPRQHDDRVGIEDATRMARIMLASSGPCPVSHWRYRPGPVA